MHVASAGLCKVIQFSLHMGASDLLGLHMESTACLQDLRRPQQRLLKHSTAQWSSCPLTPCGC